jgi:threonylcarbamoyladenosine tRNA methylthiotransferase MtaB
MAQKKVAFYTLGCKLNFAETSTIARQFVENGYSRVEFGDPTDVVVINTCSVTQLADKKCRQSISKAVRTSPDALVAVIGCYSQLKPEEISQIEGVDLVLGTNEKVNIVAHVQELESQKQSKAQIISCDIQDVTTFSPSFSMLDRTRSFLKVQDGCDYNCSYCTIPMARGNSRNNSIERTLAEARKIGLQDPKEVVLTGINIGDFGRSTGETFFDLIRELDKIEGIERYRISSIEPNLLTTEIIEFVSKSRSFMPHFHIPLQSGSNDILKLMSRRYLREVFAERVNSIRKHIPNACIGADVIVGFPGETDELFADTYSFIDSLDISYLHVFSYSERRNTRAVTLSGKVAPKLKESRSKSLIDLSENKRLKFYRQNIGDTRKVLFESQQAKGKMFGFTDNYIKVETSFDKDLINQSINVNLTEILPSGNMGIRF